MPALAAVLLIVFALMRSKRMGRPFPRAGFPKWGWLGLALVGAGWALAWNPGVAPSAWRSQSFSVLWLGYVLSMNALAYRRAGIAPLTHRTAWFLWLFPASAAAWWLFEYLNQFTANWRYLGVANRSDLEYLLQGMLPFSTVLPAIASTQAWLGTFAPMQTVGLPALRGTRALAWAALLAGIASLGAIGVWPEVLYPFVWVGPVLVLGALQPLLGVPSYFAPLARGDWRNLLQPALAALVCGFFWELWNAGSLPKWEYSVPYVQRFALFEMPLLGYAGYLPFGVACALAMDCLAKVGRPTTRESAE